MGVHTNGDQHLLVGEGASHHSVTAELRKPKEYGSYPAPIEGTSNDLDLCIRHGEDLGSGARIGMLSRVLRGHAGSNLR